MPAGNNDISKSNIILIGFMGSGKTTIGKKISTFLKCDLIDTDNWIEIVQKQSITDIFSQKGEDFFRKKETELLKRLAEAKKHPCIIATGGGMPLAYENRQILKQLGKVFYLKVTAEAVFERLKKDKKRPLLSTDDPKQIITKMLKERNPIYTETADFIIETSDLTFNEIVIKILENHKNDLHFKE